MIHNDPFAPNPIIGTLSNPDTAPNSIGDIMPSPDTAQDAPAQDVLAGAISPSRLLDTLTKIGKRVRKISGPAPLLPEVTRPAHGHAPSSSAISIHPLPSSSDNTEAVAPATAPGTTAAKVFPPLPPLPIPSVVAPNDNKATPTAVTPRRSRATTNSRPPLTTRHRVPTNVCRPSLAKNHDDASKAPRVSMIPLLPAAGSGEPAMALKRSPGMLEISPLSRASCDGGDMAAMPEYPTIGQLIRDLARERDSAQRIAREAEAKLSKMELLLAEAAGRARLLADKVQEKDNALAKAKGEAEETATTVTLLTERLIEREAEIKSLGCEMIGLHVASIGQEQEIGDLRGKLARAEDTIAALASQANPALGAGSEEPCRCSASAQFKDKEDELRDTLGALHETKAALCQRNELLEARTAQLSATEEELKETIAALAENKAPVENRYEQLAATADTLEATKGELEAANAELDDCNDQLSFKTFMCSSYEGQITLLTGQREDLKEEIDNLRRQMDNGSEANPRWSGHTSTAAIGDCHGLGLGFTLIDDAPLADEWRESVFYDETPLYDVTQAYDTTIDRPASRASPRAFPAVWEPAVSQYKRRNGKHCWS